MPEGPEAPHLDWPKATVDERPLVADMRPRRRRPGRRGGVGEQPTAKRRLWLVHLPCRAPSLRYDVQCCAEERQRVLLDLCVQCGTRDARRIGTDHRIV